MSIKLILVEDDKGDRQGFIQSVEQFNHQYNTDFVVVECDSVGDALRKLDGSFDGAVIDMKLGDVGGEGNELLKILAEKNIRIPVVILTGTPNEADKRYVHIDVKEKGVAKHSDILEDFRLIHASGLTKVMGGRGLLEEFLSKVYKSNILCQKETWKQYGQINPDTSEKALMRHVMSHLMHLVDMDEESCVPEEFYLFPPVDTALRTASVVQCKESEDFYAIMNPLCDLTKRADGEFKARQITLCKISSIEECLAQEPEKKRNRPGAKETLSKSLDKNSRGSYHALPATSFFGGGYLDFECLISVPTNNFEEEYKGPILQIASAFTKDIVARFSAFYGRQGQPALTHA